MGFSAVISQVLYYETFCTRVSFGSPIPNNDFLMLYPFVSYLQYQLSPQKVSYSKLIILKLWLLTLVYTGEVCMCLCLTYCNVIFPSLLALVNRNDPICITPPKVAKASIIVTVTCCCHWSFCLKNIAYGNSALRQQPRLLLSENVEHLVNSIFDVLWRIPSIITYF
jgi:hypothetical protein